MKNKLYEVTNEFIGDNSCSPYTECWTAKQLEQLGVSWPPQKGWRERSIGMQITEEQAAIFIGIGFLKRDEALKKANN